MSSGLTHPPPSLGDLGPWLMSAPTRTEGEEHYHEEGRCPQDEEGIDASPPPRRAFSNSTTFPPKLCAPYSGPTRLDMSRRFSSLSPSLTHDIYYPGYDRLLMIRLFTLRCWVCGAGFPRGRNGFMETGTVRYPELAGFAMNGCLGHN